MKKMHIILTDDNKIIIDCEGYQGDASCLGDAVDIIQTIKELGVEAEVGDVIKKEEDRVRDVGQARVKQ